MQPKYSIDEIERRWLVPVGRAEALLHDHPHHTTDKYLNNSRLRLRKVESSGEPTVYKLCKKYGHRRGASEAITNLYLDAAEYESLNVLPGAIISKRRYRIDDGSLDEYDLCGGRLFIFEKEFASADECAAYQPPFFADREITGIEAYSGAALARDGLP